MKYSDLKIGKTYYDVNSSFTVSYFDKSMVLGKMIPDTGMKLFSKEDETSIIKEGECGLLTDVMLLVFEKEDKRIPQP